MSWSREHEPDLKAGGNLLKVFRAEIRSVVGIKDVGDATDFLMGITFAPDALA